MLGGRHVAQKVRARGGGHGPADGSRDVVVARRDVGDERPEHVKRRVVAQALLQLHVGGDLVERHMARPLHHHLHARVPCAAHELADLDELGDLARVGGVVGGPGAHGVAQADGDIVLVQDGKHLVVELVEGVFVAGGLHPGEDERPAAAHDVREPARLTERLDDPAVHAGVDGDEVHAVLGMRAHHIEEVGRFDADERLFQITDGVVHRHGADHRRRPLDERPAKRRRLAAVRQIHDGLSAQLQRHVDLPPFLGFVGDIARDAEVHVHLRAQTAAHALGREAPVVDVRGDGDAPRRHTFADELRVAPLLLGHGAHGGRDRARAGMIDLRDRCRIAARRGADLRHRTPFVGITHVRFVGSKRTPALPLSPPVAAANSELPGYEVVKTFEPIILRHSAAGVVTFRSFV